MVIHNFQCTNCHMVAADNTWRAAVQVRVCVCAYVCMHECTYVLYTCVLRPNSPTHTIYYVLTL
jgi:hypothetical protein